MNLPRLAIGRPVTMAMLAVVVVALGFVALTQLPLDLLPSFQFPVAAVITSYPGAGPREVENLVTRPIEQSLATVANVTSLQSTSSRGQSVVLAEFDWGTDMDFATLGMRERIDRIRGLLPDEAEAPTVVTFDPSQLPIMALVLEGDAPPDQLRRLADDVVQPRLERLEGVASVGTAGGLQRQIQVRARPAALQAYQVSLDQIVQVLRAENINQPGGSLVEGGREYLLRTSGEFQSLEEIEALRVPTPTGASVALRDLADVEDTFADVTELTRLNGNPSIGLSIQKEAQANTVDVARRIRAEAAQIEAELGPGYRLATVLDQAEYIELSIQQISQNAAVGALLAGLVLLLFLRSVPATLVVALAIPISVVATFVLVYFSGLTLNIISLGGLALGIGMLVDNGIVVLESIHRHRSLGKPAPEAADVGAREVAMAITASTLTTIAVFLPVVFIQGIAAQLFRDLALTVTFSLLASLVVSLTLVPLLSSRLLAGDGSRAESGWMERLKAAYGRALGWSLDHRGLTLLGAGVLLGLSLLLIPRIGTEFLPPVDEGTVRVTVTMPIGTPLAETDRTVRRLEERVAAIPEVETVYASVGGGGNAAGIGGGALGGASGDGATLDVRLLPRGERSRSTAQVAEEIRSAARDLPGATVSVSSDMMTVGLTGSPIVIELRGDDEERMMALAGEIADRLRRIPGTREVETSLDDPRPEYTLVLRRDRAQELGLGALQIASTLETAVDGRLATRYRSGAEETDVLVRLDPAARNDLAALSRIPIATARAGMVPLGAVATFVPTQTPRTLQRSEQSRVISVTGGLAGRDLGSVTADIQQELASMEIPPDVQVTVGGQTEQMQEAFGQLGLALVLGIFLVYAIMAAQFESLRHPLAILFSVPLAAIGVLFGLWVTGRTLSVPAFIGVIMLAGIVVNNAIVLVDYVNTLRRQGMERREALIEGGRTRLRPILMTAATTVLAMIPLALGLGEGSEIQAPMATVVVFGLLFSTLLTLVVIPLMYGWLEDLGARFQRHPGTAHRTVNLFLMLAVLGALASAAAPAAMAQAGPVPAQTAGSEAGASGGPPGAATLDLASPSLRLLTLEEAVALAEERNVSFQRAEAELDDARLALEETRARSLMQPNPVAMLQAETGLELARRNLVLARSSLRLDVERAFYAVLRVENLMEVAQEGLALAERQQAVAQDRFDVGTVAEVDVIRASGQVAAARANLLRLQGQATLALLQFRQTLGLSLDEPVRPAPETVEVLPLEVDLAADLSFAQENRVEVLQARSALEAARKQVELADNDYTPKQSLERAKVGVRLAELALRQARDGVALEVRQIHQTLLDAERQLGVLEQGVAAARETLRITQAMYEAGAATDLELLNAQSAFIQARTDQVNARFDWREAQGRYTHAVARVLAESEARP